MKHKKTLFIAKKRHTSDGYTGASYGLINSARFVAETLDRIGIRSPVWEVDDANSIDRAVTKHDPKWVFIEALWATPEKLLEIMSLPRHSERTFVVRVHSKLPFLANEGMAFDWLSRYKSTNPRLIIAPNSPEFTRDLLDLDYNAVYLPNIYVPGDATGAGCTMNDGTAIEIGCFGALRPMKNHLLQAVAAMRFGDHVDQKVRFHINATRQEQQGDNVLKNLRGLFAGSRHELIEQPWMDHPTFLRLVRSMDLALQVSLSESFNIVAADCVACGVPIVVSPDISWLPSNCKASPNSTEEIVYRLRKMWSYNRVDIAHKQHDYLRAYNINALREWRSFLRV
jgi:glycosyltransferase involved in cell wall biosynthesis